MPTRCRLASLRPRQCALAAVLVLEAAVWALCDAPAECRVRSSLVVLSGYRRFRAEAIVAEDLSRRRNTDRHAVFRAVRFEAA